MADMEALRARLNHPFRDETLLTTALTHSSYANEHQCSSNERLEFVGDSVLGMVVASHLYRNYPTLPEGRMTRLRSELVCERSLYEVAKRLELGSCLLLGKGEDSSGGRQRHSILADCVEAIIAALYLDGGLEVAKAFIDENILCRLAEIEAMNRDYKTELQELVQQTPGNSVTYAMTGESGPDHDKRFTSSVLLCGSVIGCGEGRTKKEAEQMAARAGLAYLAK